MKSEIAILKTTIERPTKNKTKIIYALRGEIVRVLEVKKNMAFLKGRNGKFACNLDKVEI